jgi:hypothetical protein
VADYADVVRVDPCLPCKKIDRGLGVVGEIEGSGRLETAF